MFFLYSCLTLAAFLVAAPFWAFKMAFRPELRRGMGERLGFLPRHLRQDGRDTIWVHAVSVGEVRAARSILQGLVREHPGYRVLLSVTTPSGRKVAEGLDLAVHGIFQFPVDLPWIPGKVLDAIHCRMFISMETELWPNLLRACAKRDIPALLLNGRISDSSFRVYRKLRFFLKKVLRGMRFAAMQTWEDAERLSWMGMPVHWMEVTGSVKFDMEIPPLDEDHPVRSLLADHPGPIWIAASTWDGEEKAVLDAAARIWPDHPDLLVVIAPRRPERFDDVAALIESRGLDLLRGSRLASEGGRATRVLLLDTLGELASLYHEADLAFVGGSLVPVGGHNIIEPASCGVPVLFGPRVENFRRVAQLLLQGGGAAQISDAEALTREVRRLVEEPELRRAIGGRGRAVAERNRGAVAKSLRIVHHYLKEEGPGPNRLLPIHQQPHHGSLPVKEDPEAADRTEATSSVDRP